MAHKKKKPDRIMAGMLAILTAFSPVVSVIPTYAASDNEMSTSVTIDNDTDSGSGSAGSDGSDGSGTSGVVIDDSVQDPSTGQTDISITDDAGDGVVSEVIRDSSSEIQIEDEDDGISIENGQDNGVILVDPSTLSGNDIQVEDTGESISVDQTMDKDVKTHALKFDFVSEHGLVKITPSSSRSESMGVRYIRVHENADGAKIASIYDNDKQLLYTSEVSNYTAFYQDSIPEGGSFTVEAIADYGYSVSTYSILMDSGADNQEDVFDQTGFVADHYQKYTWDVAMDSDKSMRIAFAESEDIDLEYENSIGLVDAKTIIENNTQNTVSGNSISDDETDGQGSIVLSDDIGEGFETISSMADEVELPEITKKEEKQAIADPIYEGYIRDNLNLDLVGKYDYLGPISTMHVKQSLYDNNALFNRTDIDDLMSDFNYPDYFLMQFETIVPIYAVNDDTDYLVAYVNTMQQDSRARIMDWDFAEYNFDGILLDDCIYDKDTGLAYIPRHNIMEGDNYYLDKIQIQLAQAIDFNAKYTESVAMAASSESDVTADACSMFEEYPTFDVGAGMDESTLEVYMNGLPIDKDFYQYDSSTGILMINHSPAIVSSVYVKGDQSRSIFSSFLSALFGLKSVKAVNKWTDMKSLGTATTKSGLDDLRVGNVMNARGAYVYGSFGDLASAGYGVTNDESKYYCYVTSTSNEAAASVASWIINGGSCPVNKDQVRLIRNSDGEINFQMDINSITSPDGVFDFSELDLDSDCYIPMRCSHIGTPIGNGTGAWPHPTICVGNSAIKMRVVATGHDDAKNTDYAIIALMTQQVTVQSGVGLFRVDVEKKGLELRINKNTGTNSQGLCKDHPRYDLKGAIFGVYRTKEGAQNANIIDSLEDPGRDNMRLGSVNCKNYWRGKGELLGTLTTKNDFGITGVLNLDRCYDEDGKRLDEFGNKLYIRELKAPLGYDLNFDVHEVPLPPRLKNDMDMLKVDIIDPPLTDPGALDMVKVPEGSIDKNMSQADFLKALQSNPEDMNGAEYVLRFYKSYPNPKLVLNEENAYITCHLKTITIGGIHGRIKLDDPNCYVSSPKWPWIRGGKAVMPMGIYTLEEVKGPPGYPIKKNKMKIIANCFQRDVTDADGKKHFEAHFNWNIDKYPGNSSDERMVRLSDKYAGYAFAWNEPTSYLNVGVYKTDENKELFKTGNKTFAGITFGLIYGEENELPGHNYKGEQIEPGHEVPDVKLEFKDDDIYVTTEHLNNGKGVVGPGTYYFIETKGNGTYLKSEERIKIVVPSGGKTDTVYFPGKDGNGVPKEEAFDAQGKPTDAIEPFENVSPPMGVELDKTTWTNFGEMETDDYILGDMTYKDYIFGKQDIGDATLEGHTFAIFHTSDNDIELKDGTIIKSAKNKLDDPENPTWKELNALYELTDGKIQENGYICDIIVTDEKGEAKTDPDAFSIGTYWVIEVATKDDYVVNNVDVGRVGGDAGVKADDLTPDGGLIKAVFKHNDKIADDGACWNPPVSGGAHIQKLDLMRDDDREHGDTDLGATFKIINASKKAVKNKYGETIPTCGLTDKPDFPTYDQVRAASETCTVYTITADKNGKADTGEHDLIYGTYYVIETDVPDGYYLNTEWVGKIVIREDGVIVPVCDSNNDLHDEYNHYYYDRVQKEPVVHPDDAVACRDQIYRGGVAVQKIDKEMDWQTAQGMGTLKGAEFTILNASGSSARNVDGKDVKSVTSRKDFQETYQQLWRIANETDSPYVMQRIYTNKEGFACTDKFDLPYGTYYIIETKAPLGYWIDEQFVGKIVIRDDGGA